MGKVLFPTDQGEGDIEELNDISGIVQDISNIEDTSFAIAIDSFNTKIGPSNTNGRLLPSSQTLPQDDTEREMQQLIAE